jgi:hypothetical protein
MSTNANVFLNANYGVEDTSVSPFSYVINRLRSFIGQFNSQVYDPYYIAGPTPFSLVFPATYLQCVLITNLSTTEAVSLYVTPYEGSPQVYVLQPAQSAGQPGGVFLYLQPLGFTAGGSISGIQALGLSSAGSTAPCEILLAG